MYLHKTSLAAEQLLIKVLQRVKELHKKGETIHASSALEFFLDNEIGKTDFNEQILETFSRLDDIDILSAMKEWQFHEDFVLSNLCKILLERDLLKIKIKKKPIKEERVQAHLNEFINKYNVTENEAKYFVFNGLIENQAYYIDKQNIHILMKSGKIVDVAKASDQFNIKALSKPVTKYYMCYPKK